MGKKQLILYTLITMILVGCRSSWKQPIPAGEIVYMTSGYRELGFIQANGDGYQTLEIDKKFDMPIWSRDGKFLYGLSSGPGSYEGYPAIWDIENGRYKICDRNSVIFDLIQSSNDVDNPYTVIVQNTWKIILMDLAKCKTITTFVDYANQPGNYSIAGFSYSHSTQKLVYGLVVNPDSDREYRIMLLDLETGEQVMLTEGINPIWSPNGSQISYLGLDGLYIVSLKDVTPKQIVDQPFFDPWIGGSPWSVTSLPRWSPDGSALIYHRCDTTKICLAEDARIYKVQISDGIEEVIVQGGEYPSWRTR